LHRIDCAGLADVHDDDGAEDVVDDLGRQPRSCEYVDGRSIVHRPRAGVRAFSGNPDRALTRFGIDRHADLPPADGAARLLKVSQRRGAAIHAGAAHAQGATAAFHQLPRKGVAVSGRDDQQVGRAAGIAGIQSKVLRYGRNAVHQILRGFTAQIDGPHADAAIPPGDAAPAIGRCDFADEALDQVVKASARDLDIFQPNRLILRGGRG